MEPSAKTSEQAAAVAADELGPGASSSDSSAGGAASLPGSALDDDAAEKAFELFIEWYGVKTPSLRAFAGFSESWFAELWVNKWFAKKEKQVHMDAYLIKYKALFDIDEAAVRPEGMPSDLSLVWDVAWLILWDQVSRNIFRNTARAYATDPRARAWVEARIMPHWARLPLPIKVSAILVYIHSEDAADLAMVEKLMEEIKGPMASYASVWGALKGIASNHSTRMRLFGRIPERNPFLGRASTPEELAFMSSL